MLLAAENKSGKNLDMGKLGTIDQKTLDLEAKKDKEDLDLLAHPSNVKMEVNCKHADGKELKQGEQGYDECLHKVKNSKDKDGKESADIKVNFGN